jgi:hypothetical protein
MRDLRPRAAVLQSPVPSSSAVATTARSQPAGKPQPVYHFHRARLSLVDDPDSKGVSVARDKIVFSLNELKGNIWSAALPE